MLLLLQMGYISIASTKDLNVLQISKENYTFAISFTLLYTSLEMYGLRNGCSLGSPILMLVSQFFGIAQSLFSILQSLTHPVNLSI